MIRHASPQVITRPSCRNAAKELLVAFVTSYGILWIHIVPQKDDEQLQLHHQQMELENGRMGSRFSK